MRSPSSEPVGTDGPFGGVVLLLSVEEAARALGLGRSKTYELIAAGESRWSTSAGVLGCRSTRSRPSSSASGRAETLRKPFTSSGVVLRWPNTDGRPLDYSNWRRRVWLPAVDTAGLQGLGFHDLRRANATAMVRAKVDVKTAQVRLGHADPRLTLAIYAQATTEGDEEAAERLGDRFMGRSGRNGG